MQTPVAVLPAGPRLPELSLELDDEPINPVPAFLDQHKPGRLPPQTGVHPARVEQPA